MPFGTLSLTGQREVWGYAEFYGTWCAIALLGKCYLGVHVEVECDLTGNGHDWVEDDAGGAWIEIFVRSPGAESLRARPRHRLPKSARVEVLDGEGRAQGHVRAGLTRAHTESLPSSEGERIRVRVTLADEADAYDADAVLERVAHRHANEEAPSARGRKGHVRSARTGDRRDADLTARLRRASCPARPKICQCINI